MVRLLAERDDTNSNVNLDRFRSPLQASYVSSHTEELWYNETVCLRMTLYTVYHKSDKRWMILATVLQLIIRVLAIFL